MKGIHIMASNYTIGAMNDPYFLAAYQSPNYYQFAASQTQQTPSFQAAQQTANAAAAPQQQETKEPEDNSSAKKWVCGAILAVGAAALCVAAYRKGGANLEGLDKMKDGFNNLWKGVSNWFKSTTKTVSDKILGNAEVFQVSEKNGQKVCQMPNKVNTLHCGDINESLRKLGASTELKQLVDTNGKLVSGSALRDYTFNCQGVDVVVKKGKIKQITEGGKNILDRIAKPVEQGDVAIKKEIEELIAKFAKGEELGRLRNIKYINTENGLTKLYSMGTVGETPKLISALTKDFAVDSSTVNAYRVNSKIDEFLKAWSEGKLDVSKLTSGKLETGLGTFVVKENGEIVELITKEGNHLKAGSIDFLDLQYKNKEIFENVSKQHALYTEKTYAIAV